MHSTCVLKSMPIYTSILFGVIKRYSSNLSSGHPIRNVVIVGAGSIGSGIAQISVQASNKVNLVDSNTDLLKKAESIIVHNLETIGRTLYGDDKEASKYLVDKTRSKVKYSTDPIHAVSESDLVIEAVAEKLEVKRSLFRMLDEIAPTKTIFASTTSLFSISDVAYLIKKKDRFGGLHFFGPVPDTKLLEVVKTLETSQEALDALKDWGKSIGKTCIICKDTPGFVVNRLLVTYIAEAIAMVERGDATEKDIDTALKLCTFFPKGPIEMADDLGLNNLLSMLEVWLERSPENPLFNPTETLKKLVSEGKLGKKSGEGFYKYNNLKYWLENHAKDIGDKRKWGKYYKIWRNGIRGKRGSYLTYC